jgi:hypothetical protein
MTYDVDVVHAWYIVVTAEEMAEKSDEVEMTNE